MLKNKKKIISLITFVLLISGLGYYFYAHKNDFDFKPSTEEVKKEVNTDENSVYVYINEPSIYTGEKGVVNSTEFNINFSESVAKIDEIGKVVSKRVEIYPKIKGVFKWKDEYNLTFMPEENYKLGTKYKVNLAKDFLSKRFDLKNREFSFTTIGFEGNVANYDFYEDAKNPQIKKASFNLKFNFPVDRVFFEKALSITLADKAYPYQISFLDFDKEVIVTTDVIKIKATPDVVYLKADNVKSSYDNTSEVKKMFASVNIPSSDNYFKIMDINTNIIRNNEKNDRPEHILFVRLSSAIKGEDLKNKISLFEFERHKDSQKTSLTFELLPSEFEYQDTFSFRYEPLKENSSLMVEIGSGLVSRDGFEMTKSYKQDLYIPSYPKELKIAFDGSVITSKGEGYLSFMSRGIEKLEVNIARISSEFINHLISQSNGNFKSPYFSNYRFSEKNISEIFTETLPILVKSKADANYSSVNLAKYVKDKKGIFIVTAKEPPYGAEDKRLVMITDLGIMIKKNQDESLGVFVSSIKEGEPLRGANVEILGLNGVPLLSKKTDKNGFAEFPKLSDFSNEKEPVAIVASYKDDISFVPYNSYEMTVNYSKFDVGGVYRSHYDKDRLSAEIFTDRGIYRPSETVNVGMIVRKDNFDIPKNIPLKVIVTDPVGKEVYDRMFSVPEQGFFELKFETSPTTMTGDYNINLYTMNKEKTYRNMFIQSKSFKVEEFVPDRLKMLVKLSKKQNKGWEGLDDLKLSVRLDNLFGAPATNRKIITDLKLEPTSFVFKDYKGYVFKDPLKFENVALKGVTTRLAENKTDDKGKAEISIDFSDYKKGTYALNVIAEGFEPDGGRSVSSSFASLVSPLKYIIGYKSDGDFRYIKKGATRKITFIAINPDLEKIVVNDLSLKLKEIRYVSSLVKQKDGIYRYQSVKKETEVKNEAFEIGEEGALISLDTSETGDYSLSLFDNRTDTVVARIDYSIAGRGNLSYSLEQSSELQLKLNKTEYNAGDEIEMNITAPFTGYGLISIESDKVYEYKWFKSDTLTSLQTIKIPNYQEGNAYVNVAFVRSFESKEIFMSPLSYAVAPFSINRNKRKMEISLKVTDMEGNEKEKYQPNEKIKIKYKTSGKSKIIIYGVDEGILQVAKYKLPSPLSTFFTKKALEVKTVQILDLIMPEFRYLKELSSIGGDESMANEEALQKNLNPFARKVNKAVAFWSGIIDADDNEREYEYEIPDYFNGSMKIMAVVSSLDDNKTGSEETIIKVRGDLIIQANAPFVTSPLDEFEVSVGITNMIEDSEQEEFKVKATVSDNLEFLGENVKSVTILKNMEELARFKVKSLPILGNAEVNFSIETKKGKVFKTKATMSVRPVSPYETVLKSGFKKGKFEIKDFNIEMHKEFSNKEITVSKNPLAFSSGLFRFLEKYPHGCTEQIISKTFPYVSVDKKSDFAYKDMVKDVLSQLKSRQTVRGGFSSWNYGSDDNPFHSLYAYHFMLYARMKGYNIPESMVSSVALWARNYLKNEEIQSMWDAKLKAYAIYLLTLNEEVTTGYILNVTNYMEKNYKETWKGSIVSAFIASSYKLMHEDKKADELISFYDIGKKYTEDYLYYYSDFDTKAINDALYIYMVNAHFKEKDLKKSSIIEKLTLPIEEGNYSTLLSSYSIMALSSFGENTDNVLIKAFDNSGKDVLLKSKESIFSTYSFGDEASKAISDETGLFYMITNQGFAKKSESKTINQGIEVHKEYYVNGVRSDKAKIGEDVEVVIKTRSTNGKTNYNMAIIDLFNGGFEFVGDSLNVNQDIDYKEIREDRALIYLPIMEDMTEIRYKTKATSKGIFNATPVLAVSLYNKYLKASNKGALLFEVE